MQTCTIADLYQIRQAEEQGRVGFWFGREGRMARLLVGWVLVLWLRLWGFRVPTWRRLHRSTGLYRTSAEDLRTLKEDPGLTLDASLCLLEP